MANSELRYGTPFQSFLDTSFFQELSRLKLDVLKLDSKGQKLYSSLDWSSASKTCKSVQLFLNKLSFDPSGLRANSGAPVSGMIYNFNVFDEFKNLDKNKFLKDKGREIFESGIKDINTCIGYYIISYADLKKYRYYYWVCIPSFQSKEQIIENLGQHEVEDSSIYQDWFRDNADQWVCLENSDGEVVEYSKVVSQNCKALIVRDCCRLDGIPSAFAKNVLTVFQHDNPSRRELDALFIRPDDTSFKLKIGLKKIVNSENKGLQVNGWEKNLQGKLGPRAIDLSSLIDPLKVADQSVDLNLKLMKWRIVPDIDLDIVKKAKVLLLGAGTLGCYVSRTLMAWGVRKITLVDNGTVSYSNPVRQPLFQFDDVGKPKAQAAADALRRVFPLMDVGAVHLSVPMIGHPVTNEEAEYHDYKKLRDLYSQHDAVFLLMDSRETRWLPTVLGNVQNKTVINAALGFDSYLVMRHGNHYGKGQNRLGCYFCNDVYAPKDSLTDRTLDEMCTVTRPGVALMAASQAVELFVSILQSGKQGGSNVLGETPHQIRGFLNNFSTLKVETPAYNHCSACSGQVVSTCRELGWKFVKSALNDYKYIEDLSGLTAVQQEADKAIDEWGTDDEDDEFLV
ncbi:hypothetical protein HG535_0E00850 [Zygotorulaspora mrakii]|uniref:Ubiquitin-like modifier-activating enzyme ATG7 n=1 Tax=Zygotorulaspora mrakii TaxID=42260 RepID=A0A7H9B2W8_ZYGMR|nr:uncharacterized protein HG535_0E00850 [Zygotorulaspora mrakii]QLG73001.1 hypothetical protein HG535_0E00850 [Zygotorulaspora mrakii]